jgi:hypothetical protein
MYPEFSDAKYYKAICYAKLGKKQEEIDYLKRLKLITQTGYSINEDNAPLRNVSVSKKMERIAIKQ